MPGDLWRERTGRPGVHDVGVTDEAVGLIALGFVESLRRVTRRVDRQVLKCGEDWRVEIDVVVLVGRVPHRKRHPEESLA